MLEKVEWEGTMKEYKTEWYERDNEKVLKLKWEKMRWVKVLKKVTYTKWEEWLRSVVRIDWTKWDREGMEEKKG